ncbi:MAG: FapA family protein [Chitinivibrionales bacterium]|nr:FapA family protein [Chitinivibrionales bacterium]
MENKNPLEAFVPVETRADGLYIKVAPEAKQTIDTKKLLAGLENSLVNNFEASRIQEVVARASGAFEKIGPEFTYYNPKLEEFVVVRVTPMQAYLRLSSLCVASGVRPTAQDLVYCLKQKGIRFGIIKEKLEEVVARVIYDTEVLAAEGRAPTAGEDAHIMLEIQIERDSRPTIKADGTADFRNIAAFALVKQGDILARKKPATPGIPGTAVSGEALAPAPGKDMPLPQGKNTTVSEDGVYLMAGKAGIVVREGGLISVGETLVVDKDVDYSVGNIKHTGEVTIKGSVLPGFTIEAEGNITIRGSVDSAKVTSRNGNIVIGQGVLGKAATFVTAKDGIEIEFAQDAVIATERTLKILKYCLLCECACENVEAPHANIIGGSVQAFTSIVANSVGNEKGTITKISILDKNSTKIKEKLKELAALKAKMEKDLDPIAKQLRSKAQIFKSAGDTVSVRQRDELKKWVDTFNNINMKLKYIQEKMGELTKRLDTPVSYDGFITIHGPIYPGTEIIMYGVRKVITQMVSNKTYRCKDRTIVD